MRVYKIWSVGVEKQIPRILEISYPIGEATAKIELMGSYLNSLREQVVDDDSNSVLDDLLSVRSCDSESAEEIIDYVSQVVW